jgi:hypothetical protein
MIAKVHQNTNVPLIRKASDVFFNAGKTHNRSRGFSKGASTIFTPKLPFAALKTMLGTKSLGPLEIADCPHRISGSLTLIDVGRSKTTYRFCKLFKGLITCFKIKRLFSSGGQNDEFRPLTSSLGGRGMGCREKYVTS